MERRRIGTLEVTTVGIGCNNFGGRIDGAATEAVVGAAIDSGINFFDTSDSYSAGKSEELLAKALGAKRDEVLIATKFGSAYGDRHGGASAPYIRVAAEESLRRLGTDHIDLYQIHFPDDKVPIAETLAALGELVTAGKVREIGCSNFSVAQLVAAAEATADGAPRFASVQNQYSILHREPEDGVLAECARQGLAFLPYFPLASGLLTGKYRAGEQAPAGSRLAGMDEARRARELSDERLALVGALAALAAEEGRSVVDLAFAWLLSHEVVASVIAGATRPEQVRTNAATTSFLPSAEVLARVDALAPR
jgi:aryl-alcohol dehydrogenase-like predicted oxidoreductase